MIGITFNGKHSYDDLGLTMPTDPQIRYPEKIKKKFRIPGTNIIIDKDEGRNSQEYSERVISCTFNILDFTDVNIKTTHQIAEKLTNWLMPSVGKQRLELDIMPYHYFEAEVESVGNLDTDLFKTGELEITFTAYPFRKSKYNEGHDVWDAINFDNHVWQDVSFTLPNLTSDILPFKQLNVGDMVILGAWTTIQSTGTNKPIYHYQTEQFYEIMEKRSTTNDPSQGWFGDTEYRLDNGFWVRDQNIIQARNTWTDVTLYNTGELPITPRIKYVSSSTGSAWRGITIQRDNHFYNLRGDVPYQTEYHNDSFQLLPGKNDLRIYGQNNAIEFVWAKEVL